MSTYAIIRSPTDLVHYGSKGQVWGKRLYQNKDGSLTPLGRIHYGREQKRIQKKDAKWAKKNYKKIQSSTMKKSKKEMNDYVRNDLNKRVRMRNADGKLSRTYMNEYNTKLAELMNKNVADIRSPSGRSVRFVAKRGDVGVYMALADAGFDMSSVRRGVYSSGRIAYKKKELDRI